jgi:hypothetical protein
LKSPDIKAVNALARPPSPVISKMGQRGNYIFPTFVMSSTFLQPSFIMSANITKWRLPMATPLDSNDLVTFKELLMANSIQVDAAAQLLIEKGFFTKDEFFRKLKQVQAKYQSKAQ